MTRITHKYILYVYVPRLDRHCKCIEFNTIEKIIKFISQAKLELQKPLFYQSYYYKHHVPRGADLDKYYIRHIETEIEVKILKDEVLENE